MRKGFEKKFRLIILAISALPVLFLGAPAQSEPDANAEYVLKEPLTLMDFGLYRAEAVLDGSLDSFRFRTGILVLTYAKYNRDSNSILLSVTLPETKISPTQCEQIIQEVRHGGALRDGKLMEGLMHSIYADGFKHDGLSDPDAPEGYLAGLDRIIVIKVIGETECSSPLLGARFAPSKD